MGNFFEKLAPWNNPLPPDIQYIDDSEAKESLMRTVDELAELHNDALASYREATVVGETFKQMSLYYAEKYYGGNPYENGKIEEMRKLFEELKEEAYQKKEVEFNKPLPRK